MNLGPIPPSREVALEYARAAIEEAKVILDALQKGLSQELAQEPVEVQLASLSLWIQTRLSQGDAAVFAAVAVLRLTGQDLEVKPK